MTEFRRVWNKKFWILIVLCLILNSLLYLYQQLQGNGINQFYQNEEQYQNLIQNYSAYDLEEALNLVEQEIASYGTDEKDNMMRRQLITLKSQLSYLSDYNTYVNSVIENAEKMKKYRIFSDQQSFSYHSLILMETDYNRVANVELELEDNESVSNFTSYSYMNLIIMLLMVVVIYKLFEERENGMWMILHSLPNGRMHLGRVRAFLIVVSSFLLTFTFYIFTLLESFLLYGGIHTLLTPIQNISKYGDYTYLCSKFIYLLKLFLFQWLAIMVVSFLLWMIFAIVRKRNIAVFIAAIMTGLEFICYLNRSEFTVWKYLNRINLIRLFHIDDMIASYQNVGYGVHVIQLYKLVMMIVTCFIILFIIIGVLHTKLAYPQKNKTWLQNGMERCLEKYQILLSKSHFLWKECHKLLVTGKGIWMIAVMVSLVLYFARTGVVSFSDVEQNLDEIYLELGGEDYNQIIELVNQRDREYTEAVDQLDQVSAAYQSGNATLGNVEEASNSVQYYATRRKMVAEFKTKIAYLSEIKEQYHVNGWLISDRGYEQIIGEDGRNREIIILLLLVFCNFLIVSDSFMLEYETGMNQILHATVRGRQWIDARKIGVCIGVSAINLALVSIIDYYCLYQEYGMPYLNAPVLSLSFMSCSVPNISILIWIILKLILQLILIVIVTLVAIVESKRLKKNGGRVLIFFSAFGLAVLVAFGWYWFYSLC